MNKTGIRQNPPWMCKIVMKIEENRKRNLHSLRVRGNSRRISEPYSRKEKHHLRTQSITWPCRRCQKNLHVVQRFTTTYSASEGPRQQAGIENNAISQMGFFSCPILGHCTSNLFRRSLLAVGALQSLIGVPASS